MKLLALVAAMCGLALLSTPGQSWGALYFYESSGGANSSVFGFTGQRVVALCGPGQAVVGSGTRLDIFDADIRPLGQVVIDDVSLNADLGGATVLAVQDEDGVDGRWHLSARASCAEPPAGLELVTATTALSSETKSVTAPCPGAKRVLGMGAQIHGGAGLVLLDDIRPHADLGAVTVQAVEQDTGTSRFWAVTAQALCADPIAGLEVRRQTTELSSAGGAGLGEGTCGGVDHKKFRIGGGTAINGGAGQVAISATGDFSAAVEDQDGYAAPWSLTDYAICATTRHLAVGGAPTSSDDKEGRTFCGIGTVHATGGGVVLSGPPAESGQVWMEDMVGLPAIDGVEVDAVEDETGTDEPWTARGFAICARGLEGIERPHAIGPLNSQANKTTTVRCSDGKRVLGAFAGVNTDGGQVVIDDMTPSADLRSVTVKAAEDETGYPAAWSLTAMAVCGNPLGGLERVAATSELSSAGKAVTATCPGARRLYGTGADINGGAGQVVLTALRPSDELDSVEAAAVEDENGYAAPWSLTTYAICADP